MKKIRFELAGKRRKSEQVFLMSDHRKHKINKTIFHRNDYHTVVIIPHDVFKENFSFNRSTYIYDNLTGITWHELEKVADIEVIKLN